ncbi:FecR family protein [Terrarubrum flagellatum]|uniref:FecR family protein n=1 Tax=Terrirubrum flagellatum TaxID=2895980 RepID=UPI003145178C
MRKALFVPAILAMLAAGGERVAAQVVIGEAAQAAPNVTGTLGARRAVISSGDSVHQNELVQTTAAGGAMLSFEDSTRLSVGPSSSVRLDKFVYNPDATARQAVVNMTRGVFRFATGVSNPRAFTLQTPQAVIGIRGTIVEFEVSSSVSRITLQRGAITVCARVGRRTCLDAGAPGQVIVVTSLGEITLAGGFNGRDLTGGGDTGGIGDGGGRGGGDSGGRNNR